MSGMVVVLATRYLVFGLFAVAFVVAATHYGVKHGKLSPFSPFARGVRQISPHLLKPFERSLYRGGGNPANAPYVFFWVALIGGLLLIGAVQWVVALVYDLAGSAAAGPRSLVRFAVSLGFSVLMIAIFLRVIASWFGASPYSRAMRLVHGLTDWLLDPLRRVIPPIGMIDITPMVAYLMLLLARGFVLGLI
jgi:YggT family protein